MARYLVPCQVPLLFLLGQDLKEAAHSVWRNQILQPRITFQRGYVGNRIPVPDPSSVFVLMRVRARSTIVLLLE